ncbi:MAG: 50S ribosomal protein L9 [Deltaproteobacteria bacterium]|jgi:large subunit ribosomal protein L9|nr:50S ribosomal protein L9 [Deltaproteobacteria bacterium]
MEIILTQDVENLGLAGQVLKVSAGYARNYLLPGAFALPATPNNLKTLAKKRIEFERRALAAKEEAQEQKKLLAGLVLTITRKSVEKGKLYGAVTPQDLVDAAKEQGFDLDRRKLKIAEPIKSIGDYDISVRLHPEVSGSFKVKVLAEPKPEPEPAPPEPEGKGRKGRKPRATEAKAEDAPAEGPGPEAPKAEEADAPKGKAAKAQKGKAPKAKPEEAKSAEPEAGKADGGDAPGA